MTRGEMGANVRFVLENRCSVRLSYRRENFLIRTATSEGLQSESSTASSRAPLDIQLETRMFDGEGLDSFNSQNANAANGVIDPKRHDKAAQIQDLILPPIGADKCIVANSERMAGQTVERVQ